MAQPIHFADRMTAADALLWNIESDPCLRSTITGVYTLEQAPDWDRFLSNLERTTLEIPRLRQRVVSDPLELAPPRWEIDPNFDLNFHFRRVSISGEGSLRDLLDMAQPIGMQAFDRDRPLWELYAVEGLAGGRTGLIFKLHHAVSDGVGMVRMTGGLMERSPDGSKRRQSKPMPPTPLAERATNGSRILDAAKHALDTQIERGSSIVSTLGSSLSRFVREPRQMIQELSDTTASIGRMLAPISEPMSPIMRERSLSIRFHTIVVPLKDLKRAAKSVGGTVNDAFVGAVSGGLRKYHEEMGEPVSELRMNMPVNTRSSDNTDAGNQFAPVRFAVPVGIADPAKLMRRIHQLVEEQRDEPALPLMEGISAAMGALPLNGSARIAASMLKAIDFTTSNVPGPQFPVYVSGARIENMFGFGPLAGAAANITCFSYDGNVAISVNVDPAAVTNPELFAECLQKGVDEVLAVV